MDQNNPPERFRDLTRDRQKAWSDQPETRLFLKQLEEDRAAMQEQVNGSCEPMRNREFSVAYRAQMATLDYLINTIKDPLS